MDKNTKPLGARIGEGSFCVIYLIFVFTAYLMMSSKEKQIYDPEVFNVEFLKLSFGAGMALLLGIGEAFHLIPRIIYNFKGSLPWKDVFFGAGNLISSITMTIFYDVLMGLGDSLEYDENQYNYNIENSILVLMIIRIIILLLPMNRWTSGEPNTKWAVIRNIPFVMIGFLTVIGYLNVINHAVNYPVSLYIQIIIAVILSFAFYLPVAVKGKTNPKLGMLMIPKTLCYMWMITVIWIY